MTVITRELAAKVLSIVDQGLSMGLGIATPGSMCVEAAVCYALGQPHGDRPECVGDVVRGFKVVLNDASWSSKTARAKGMRRIAIAQLGSTEIDMAKFSTHVLDETIKRILPFAMRLAAKGRGEEAEILAAADRVEKEGGLLSLNMAEEALTKSFSRFSLSQGLRTLRSLKEMPPSSSYISEKVVGATKSLAVGGEHTDTIFSMLADIGVEALTLCGAEGVQFLEVAG
jgi:hypothetical protein